MHEEVLKDLAVYFGYGVVKSVFSVYFHLILIQLNLVVTPLCFVCEVSYS